jgi:hypothetical protein
MPGIWGDGPRGGIFGARVDPRLQAELERRADMRRSYTTSLSPMEELKFRDWKQRFAPNDSGEDYDLRGAFKAGFQPDPETGHWPDTFKKPNHPTFSDQSIYAKDRPDLAGAWDGDTYVPAARRRIAGAFEAAEGMQEPSRALYEAKHRRAQQGHEPPPEPGLIDALLSLGSRAVGGAQKINASVLESGHSWFKLGDEAKRLSPEEVLRRHDTYPWVIASPGGEYVGTRPMPVELVFPGLARRVRHMDASGKQRTATMADVFEVITQQKLDKMMEWLQSPEGKKLGIVGAVGAGLLTAGEASQLFGEGQEDQTDRPKA